MPQCLRAVTQLAGQIGANVELVLADRLLVVHVVKAGHLMHGNRRHAEIASHQLFTLGTHKTLLLLHNRQTGHHGRLFLVRGVLRYFAVKKRFGLF